MALKLPDSAVPMGDFPVAKAVDIDFDDGENLQEKLDNGALGGDNSTHKTVIFENNIDMGKYLLLAKITNANYSNNIIKFSCPNYKGVNDTGFKYENDMDIYKFELHFNTGSRRENNGYGVTLKQHGLGLYSYPLNNPQNTSPKIEEAIRLYWDYSNGDIYVFLVDLMTAIPHCVLEYTGSGTLIRNNTFVNDDLYNRRDGLNGTWEDSKWSSISYNKLETPPIYELGGDGGSAGGTTTYTSLSQLGLTEPVSVGEIFNAMPNKTIAILACEAKDEDGGTVTISDIPTAFGVLTIKKNEKGRFSIEYQNSLQGSSCDVKRWIGTLKGLDGTGLYWKEIQAENGEVITSDTIAKYGTEILKYPIGTWRIDSVNIGKQFTDLPYAEMAGVIEIDSIQPNKSPYEHAYGYRNYIFRDALTNVVYTRSLNSGNTVGTIQRDSGWCTSGSHFYKLSQMYLTVNATIQDVIDTLPIGGTALLRTDEFTNWSTLFNGIQWGYLKIEKTVNGLSNIELQEVVEPSRKYFGAQSSGKFSKWQKIHQSDSKTTLAFNSSTFKIDITKGNENWNGNMKFGYVVDRSYGEITISSMGKTEVLWDCSEGVRYVKSVTYTIDPNNNAHVTIGVELYHIAYGVHQLEMAGDFATINSFTGDAFTGTSVAKRGGAKGRNNGVGLLCEVEDLGLTFPCTTVQIVQAMRDLSNTANRMPSNSMIGIFNCGPKAETITDAPTDYGLLHVETNGHDRVSIRFDSISGSNHAGSWIGQIKGSNGTFNSVTWSRIDIENRVDELFQSVSSGKTLVANAITGKGVSTATNATFATMATNISKISGGYKEETKSLIVTSNSTGTQTLTFTFSANVIAVKQIVAPSDSCRIVPQTSKDMLTINGKELIVYVTGTGTWKATALVRSS